MNDSGQLVEPRCATSFEKSQTEHSKTGKLMKKSKGSDAKASQLITNPIAELGDWRGKLLARLRKLILEAAPEITEEWKWNTAVYTSNGLVCAVGAFK